MLSTLVRHGIVVPCPRVLQRRRQRGQLPLSFSSAYLGLNPSDNKGIRFLLPDVRAREAWVDEDE